MKNYIVPSLAAMAALTLFHNPNMQPEDVSVPYGDLAPYATRIQRRQRRRRGAITTIAAAIRGWFVRSYYLILEPFGGPRYNNVLAARLRYRSTSRNRTFGNIPLSMQQFHTSVQHNQQVGARALSIAGPPPTQGSTFDRLLDRPIKSRRSRF